MSVTWWLFCDLESTGLDTEQDEIVEVAFILVDAETLDEVGRYHSLVVPTNDGMLRLVGNPFVLRMHTKNGLLLELVDQPADARRDVPAIDTDVSGWLELRCGVDREGGDVIHLAGSGVAEFDRPLIRKWMPATEKLLHYRSIDIGGPRRMVQAWLGRELTPDNERKAHRAMADVEGHLREAEALRDMVMVYSEAETDQEA